MVFVHSIYLLSHFLCYLHETYHSSPGDLPNSLSLVVSLLDRYGSSFRFVGDYLDNKPYDSIGRRKTRIAAIDALCSPRMWQYEVEGLVRYANFFVEYILMNYFFSISEINLIINLVVSMLYSIAVIF